jgi:hypothetical protein
MAFFILGALSAHTTKTSYQNKSKQNNKQLAVKYFISSRRVLTKIEVVFN